MIIRYFGHEGLAARIREHCRLAKLFASWVEEDPNWELMAPAPLALVCFRACPTIDAPDEAKREGRLDVLNEAIMHGVHGHRQSFVVAHETKRQNHAAAFDRQYSDDGETRAPGLGFAKRTVKVAVFKVKQTVSLLSDGLEKAREAFGERSAN